MTPLAPKGSETSGLFLWDIDLQHFLHDCQLDELPQCLVKYLYLSGIGEIMLNTSPKPLQNASA
jgi:hypothetical protein